MSFDIMARLFIGKMMHQSEPKYLVTLPANPSPTGTHGASCQWGMVDGRLLIASWAAGQRSRRHHFISSRLTEGILTGCPNPSTLLTSLKSDQRQSRLRIPLGTTPLTGWGYGWGLGGWISYMIIQKGRTCNKYQFEGCLFAWCVGVSGLTLAQSIRRCPSQMPTTAIVLSVPKGKHPLSLWLNTSMSHTVIRPELDLQPTLGPRTTAASSPWKRQQ